MFLKKSRAARLLWVVPLQAEIEIMSVTQMVSNDTRVLNVGLGVGSRTLVMMSNNNNSDACFSKVH